MSCLICFYGIWFDENHICRGEIVEYLTSLIDIKIEYSKLILYYSHLSIRIHTKHEVTGMIKGNIIMVRYDKYELLYTDRTSSSDFCCKLQTYPRSWCNGVKMLTLMNITVYIIVANESYICFQAFSLAFPLNSVV